MKLKELHMENFLPFKNTTINMDKMGLVLLSGDNQDSPASNSNGAGKTGTFSGVSYALYGKALNGAEADEVINEIAQKNCLVSQEVVDEESNILFKIVRTRKHDKFGTDLLLYANGKDIRGSSMRDTQEKIAKLIGMSFETFVQSIMFGQKVLTQFSEATDKERKEILEDVLGVSLLSDCQLIAKKKAKLYELNILSAQTLLKQKQVGVEREQQALDIAMQQIKNYDKTQASKVAEIQRQIDVAGRNEEKIQKSISELHDKVGNPDLITKEIEEKTAQRQTVQDELNQSYKLEESELTPLKEKLAVSKAELERIKDEVRKFKSMSGLECPECKQPVSPEHYASVTAAMIVKGKGLKITCVTMETDLETKKATFETLKTEKQAQIESLSAELRIKQRDLQVAQTEERTQTKLTNDLHMAHMHVEMFKKNLQTAIDDAESTKRLLEANVNTNSDRLEKELSECKTVSAEIDSKMEELNNLMFWVQGFGDKGLKSYVMETVFPVLTKRANHYADLLSDGNFRIEFVAQSETKKGDLKEKIDVKITNKSGSDNYKMNSSGERRRIDLCILLAIQDLVSNRSKKKINISLFDEIYDNLDATGIEYVMRLLNTLKKEKDTIMVISHSEDLKPKFSKEITVVKKGGYSAIEMTKGFKHDQAA